MTLNNIDSFRELIEDFFLFVQIFKVENFMKRECFVVPVVLFIVTFLIPVFGYSVGSIKELKGVVKDSGGEPLAGVVVKVVKGGKDDLSGSKEIKKE